MSRGESVFCKGNHFVTDVQFFFRTDVGLTNIELTCSDGTVPNRLTANEIQDDSQTLSCDQGFASFQDFLVSFHASGGTNQNKAGLYKVCSRCDNDAETNCASSSVYQLDKVVTTAGSTRQVQTWRVVGPAGTGAICENNEKVVGLQVLENAKDPDGGIPNLRVICREIQ